MRTSLRRCTLELDLDRQRELFAHDVRRGLGARQKHLPCKYFYDARGAALFERICRLPEYYLARTELEIMRRHVAEMAGAIGKGATVVELGSGEAIKTRLLLDHLAESQAYVPVDLADEQLEQVSLAMSADYPQLEVHPIHADFTEPVCLPESLCKSRRLVYFPGSTIGNFGPEQAELFLSNIRKLCGSDGCLLIGVDLKKDPAILHQAYNDADGVTAQFNLNILRRINAELDGTFDLDSFDHYAFYHPGEGRIEMHLVSRVQQVVTAAGARYCFEVGESIFTESSYKYGLKQFTRLASGCGFRPAGMWTDERQWFSLHLFNVAR